MVNHQGRDPFGITPSHHGNSSVYVDVATSHEPAATSFEPHSLNPPLSEHAAEALLKAGRLQSPARTNTISISY